MPIEKIKDQLEKEKKIEKDTLKDANDRQSLLRLVSKEVTRAAGREVGALSIKAAAKALGLIIFG